MMYFSEDGRVLACPDCGSTNFIRKGFHRDKQRYKCTQCHFHTTNPLKLDKELLAENVKLAKRTQRFMDSNRIERKSFREFARIENALVDYNKSLIETLKEKSIGIATIKHEEINSGSAGILQFSDVHFNELVHRTPSLNNQYDFKIAAQRCKKYIERAKIYFKANNVSHILIAMSGDILNSDRRIDELLNMATNRAQATILAIHILSQVIEDLNQDFNITITCVSGNESRIKKDHEFSEIIATDNYDWTIYEILSMLFKDKDGMEFVKGSAREFVINVNGQNVLIMHGDSIPKAGVEKKVLQIKGKWRDKGVDVDFIIFGHFHSARIGDTYARCSSMTGANAYSDDALQLSARASQNIHIIHDKNNRDSIKIDLQDTKGIKGYEIFEELESYNAKSSIKCHKPITIFKIQV